MSAAGQSTSTFRVRARPSDRACRVRVEGRPNAEWLHARLSKVFTSCEPICLEEDSSFYVFRVPFNNARLSRFTLERMLGGISEIQLMLEPEENTAREDVNKRDCSVDSDTLSHRSSSL